MISVRSLKDRCYVTTMLAYGLSVAGKKSYDNATCSTAWFVTRFRKSDTGYPLLNSPYRAPFVFVVRKSHERRALTSFTWLAHKPPAQICVPPQRQRQDLFVTPPNFVANLPGDHAIADMEVV